MTDLVPRAPRSDFRAQVHPNLRGRLLGRLRAASLIGLPEPQFAKFLQQIESDPLFTKLFLPGNSLPRVIRRNPWPRTRLYSGFYELNESLVIDPGSVNVESLLAKHGDLVRTIRLLGREAFERYFLYGEGVRSLEEIATLTGLSLEKVKRIYELVLEFSVESQFFQPRLELAGGRRPCTLIAYMHTDQDLADGISFSMTQPYLARGRYSINKEALDEWVRAGALTREERQQCRGLLQKIELANLRQNTLLRILEAMAEGQAKYLRSQKRSDIRPLTMRALARHLSLAPSTISRAAAFRSVMLPWNQQVPLTDLLPNRREVVFAILDEAMKSVEISGLSDRILSSKLEKEYSLKVSRRSLNECRRYWEKQS